MKLPRYCITLLAHLIMLTSYSAIACELNLSLVDANFLKNEGPEDERYQAFYVGTISNDEESFYFRSPRYVILNKQDCKIAHIYHLPKDQPGAFTHVLLLNKMGKNILISSIWTEIKYNEQGDPVSRSRMNVISSYDYNSFEHIQIKKFKKSVYYPGSLSILTEDGKLMYYYVAKQRDYPVYEMSLPDLTLLGEFVLDKEYLAGVGLEDFESKSFTNTARKAFEYKNMWHDFEEQPLLRLWAWDSDDKARGIFYTLKGKPVSAVWRENGKVLSASPIAYEKRFSLKIKSLPYYAISHDDPRQGVNLLNSISADGNTTTLLGNAKLIEHEPAL